jgi:hypothetical protein
MCECVCRPVQYGFGTLGSLWRRTIARQGMLARQLTAHLFVSVELSERARRGGRCTLQPALSETTRVGSVGVGSYIYGYRGPLCNMMYTPGTNAFDTAKLALSAAST